MYSNISSLMLMNLQLFADGGAGGAAAGAGDGGTASGEGVTAAAALPQTKGVKNNPLANVKYGIQEDVTPAAEEVNKPAAPVDRNAEFEKLIKGEYKDLYDAKVQDTVRKRLAKNEEKVNNYNALSPTLELLAKKYGVDASNIEALNKAIEEDDSYFEEEALEKGVTVQELKRIRSMERENAELKRQMEQKTREENASKLYSAWMKEADTVKSVYPSFNLEAEMQNPKFIDLLRSHIDVRTAYEVLHKDEIIPAAMQFTAKAVEQKLTNKIIANGARPAENGMSAQSAALTKSDVSQLSKADRQEIIRRVQRGEKIRF